jgi:hypothetical protein
MAPKRWWSPQDAAGAGFSQHNFFLSVPPPPPPPPGPGRPKKSEKRGRPAKEVPLEEPVAEPLSIFKPARGVLLPPPAARADSSTSKKARVNYSSGEPLLCMKRCHIPPR